MNQRDRNRLARLYSCLSRLPWPNRGRTIGPKELSEFFYAMGKLTPIIRNVVMYISRCDVEDPDGELDYLEEMLERYK